MARSHRRVGSIEWNRAHWGDDAAWEERGNSWTFHADDCGQPYESWKKTLLGEFLDPYLSLEADFLEIGPGYGRWTESMVGRTHSLTLVDLNANCIEVCRQRFGLYSDVSFVANDGQSLPAPEGSIDVVWSFGSFVHFDTREIAAYLGECARVLRVGGRFVIHHAGWPEWSLATLPVTQHMGRSGRVLQHRISQGRWRPGGDRTPMSAHWFASLASANGLRVEKQARTWGEEHEFGLAFNDVISIGTKMADRHGAAR
jgi:SAM-dependent methyltransferase